MIIHLKRKIEYPLSVLYIESFQNYLEVHYVNGSKNIVRSTLKAITHELPSSSFLRIHNRLIINLLRVKKYHGNKRGIILELTDCHRKFNVSRSRISEFLERVVSCDDEITMLKNDPGYTFLS